MRFTAFDFETCNGHNLSAIELGVAVYQFRRNWRLVESRSWRFHPIKDEFWPKWTQIHGIRLDQVAGLPGIIDRWEEIEPYFRNTLLVAHNAPFDVRILCAHLDHGKIQRPASVAQCTMRLGTQYLQGCNGGRLSDYCQFLRIPLDHHNATSDAVAAGKIFAHMHECFGSHSRWNSNLIYLSEWSSNRTSPAEISPEIPAIETPADGVALSNIETSARSACSPEDLSDKAMLCFQILNACQSPILSEWAVALTGDMSIERGDFVPLIRRLGARCGADGTFYGSARNPQGPTNTLILSTAEMSEVAAGKSPTRKLKDAVSARAKGRQLLILSEDHFYDEVINWYETSIPSSSPMTIKSFHAEKPFIMGEGTPLPASIVEFERSMPKPKNKWWSDLNDGLEC